MYCTFNLCISPSCHRILKGFVRNDWDLNSPALCVRLNLDSVILPRLLWQFYCWYNEWSKKGTRKNHIWYPIYQSLRNFQRASYKQFKIDIPEKPCKVKVDLTLCNSNYHSWSDILNVTYIEGQSATSGCARGQVLPSPGWSGVRSASVGTTILKNTSGFHSIS